ncbi:MAG TPA: hypothetical protein VF572_05815 [Candidatus Saccharimonadales bacterium]
MKFPSERVVEGQEEIPIHEFQHPDTESTISLVGLHHVAAPQFFSEVSGYVDSREADGSVVHYERRRLPDDEAMAAYPTWVRRFAPRINRTLDNMYKLTIAEQEDDADKLVYQFDCDEISFRDDWEVHDLTMADIVLEMGHLKAGFATKVMEDLHAIDRGDKRSSDLVYGLKALGLMKAMKGAVLHKRNEVALDGIAEALQADPEQDITLLWGAAHLPGLADGVVARNYEHRDTKWLRPKPSPLELE